MSDPEAEDEWKGWSDDRLIDFENHLYDQEVAGGDTWFLRDRILNEMNRRGLCE